MYKKKCPDYKIASKLDNCKIADRQQQPTANIGHQVCISVNLVFIRSVLLAGGVFKMLNFPVACAQKFQTKNKFLALPENMECCYGMLLLGNTDAQPLKIRYFPFRAVLKMHNCFSLCLCV